jgi:hypothetical protein
MLTATWGLACSAASLGARGGVVRTMSLPSQWNQMGEEAAATLASYAASHPRAWAQLRPVLENTLGTAINENGTSLAMVVLEATVGDSSGHEPSRRL